MNPARQAISSGQAIFSPWRVRKSPTLENMLVQPLTIPGHGEAGGPEHTQHKQNYLGINLAGRLALITGEPRYGDYALALLTGYADIYPSLGSATSKTAMRPVVCSIRP